MTTPLVCLGVTTLLAYLPRVLAVSGPEARRDRLDRIARDSFDALVAFLVAIAVVHFAGADAHRVGILSTAFVVTRAAWLASHLVALDYLRSALWALGLLLTLGLFLLPLST